MNKNKFFAFLPAMLFLAPMAVAGTMPDKDCQQDTQCTLIPTNENSCFPCMGGLDDFQAVNMAMAKRIMAPRGKTCKASMREKFKKMKEEKTRPEPPKCAGEVNDAKCVAGQCEAAKLSDDEMKAKFEKMGGKRKHRHQESSSSSQKSS